MLSLYKIFIKLNEMSNPLENMGSAYESILKYSRSSSEIDNIKIKPILCFVADGGFEPWTGSDILIKGVGGSETYIIEMARNIQEIGDFKVIVFCNCVSHAIFEGVEYIPISNYSPFIANIDVHTCIISRFSEYLPVTLYGKSQNVYLVLHDIGPSGNVIPIHDKVKKIFCLSEWHAEYFLTTFPQFKDITMPFYYGIDTKIFDQCSKNLTENLNKPFLKVVDNKFIYSSFPNRGLLQLLQMWPRIVDKYPNASLHIYSDLNGKWVNSVEGEMMQSIRNLLKEYETRELSSNNKINIFHYGWVNKKELADAWKTSEYWFYPCTFMETFCLTAVEAALSKTLAITNGLAALQNTVGDRGFCIPGETSTSDWQKNAVDELFLIMDNKNKEKRIELINRNYEWASKLSWDAQAKKLNEILIT
jgi:hypothetical protein